MLSFSFDGVREASTLKCRLAFAQYVLRLEMYAEHIGIDAKVGTITPDGRRTFEFRAVEGGGKVVEDGVVVAAALDGGQEDPFRDTQPYSLQELEGHGSMVKVPSLVVPQLVPCVRARLVAPCSSAAPRVAPGHWAPSHGLSCSS